MSRRKDINSAYIEKCHQIINLQIHIDRLHCIYERHIRIAITSPDLYHPKSMLNIQNSIITALDAVEELLNTLPPT